MILAAASLDLVASGAYEVARPRDTAVNTTAAYTLKACSAPARDGGWGMKHREWGKVRKE